MGRGKPKRREFIEVHAVPENIRRQGKATMPAHVRVSGFTDGRAIAFRLTVPWAEYFCRQLLTALEELGSDMEESMEIVDAATNPTATDIVNLLTNSGPKRNNDT